MSGWRAGIWAVALGLAPGLGWAQAPAPAETAPAAAAPKDGSSPAAAEDFAVHIQGTVLEQYHPAFSSRFQGPLSVDPGSRGNEAVDATVYAGVRLWRGAEGWVNPELNQGFGLSNTVGVAAYPSGDSNKVGSAVPYVRLPRLFLRQTIGLGGGREAVAPDLNVLGGSRDRDRIVLTVGKFSVADVFDTNSYAHDARNDFFNLAVIDAGSFDYAADAWGYSYGATAEWYQGWWTLRTGVFALTVVPNTTALDTSFGQVQYLAEAEERHALWGRPGKLVVTGFVSRARMGDYLAAVALAGATGGAADIAAVRAYRSRAGISLDLEQSLTPTLGVFARAGLAEGGREVYAFTDIDRTISAGLSLKGDGWGRARDTVGIAGVVDGISQRHRRFLAAGGLGILVGDGALLHAGAEMVAETFYSVGLTGWLNATADYQLVVNPAYNRDRGPVSVFGLRLHAQY